MHNALILVSFAVGMGMIVAAYFLNRRLGGSWLAHPYNYEPRAQYLCFGGVGFTLAGIAVAEIFF